MPRSGGSLPASRPRHNVVEEGEQCDNGGSDLECDGDCTLVACGDGYENFPAGEYCDPGAEGETALCNGDCSLAMCGDTVVNMAAGEQCDDGDCFSDEGCLTDGGRCIRFRVPTDISATYRLVQDYATLCGAAPLCCSDPAGCGGGDNAWHFHNGMNNYYVGPCLGCVGVDDCTYWNNIDDGNYTRITACIRG